MEVRVLSRAQKNMFGTLETILISYSEKIPLTAFAFIASMVEEVVAPIPSPAVMIVTGSIASVQEKVFYYLLVLSILGALGKLIGAIFVYYMADKIEDFFAGVVEKFFGVTHEDIESFGKRLSGGWRDYFIMFLMRALPVVPSSLVSIGSGVLKIPMKVFIVSTFLGSIVRDFIYIYFGYAGISVLGAFLKKSESIESFIQLVALIIIMAGLVYAYIKRRKKL